MSVSTAGTRPLSETRPRPLIDVLRVTGARELAAVLEIRRRVFAEEQDAADLRIADPDDPRSIIALASILENGACTPAATGRLTLALSRTGQALIAWVATVPEARGQGAGGAVMRFLLDAADNAGARETVLAAQIHAEQFYQRLGFVAAGPLYDVRGIAHRRMVRPRGGW